MDANVEYSDPMECDKCGRMMRMMIVNGKPYSRVNVEPMYPATEKNPNAIYGLHGCDLSKDNMTDGRA